MTPLAVGMLAAAIGLSAAVTPTPAADDTRAAAEAALAEADRLSGEPKAESRRLALDAYRRAIDLSRQAQDVRGEAQALTGLGTTAFQLADFDAAQRNLQEALTHWRALGDRAQQGHVLGRIGEALLGQSRNEPAVPVLTEALAALRDAGDRRGEAQALNDLGAAQAGLGEEARAAESYERALALWRELGDRQGEGQTLTNFGVLRWQAGASQAALDLLLEALYASRAAGDRSTESLALAATSQIYNELGDTSRALRHLDQALALAREVGDRRAEAAALGAIGYAHRMSGDWDRSQAAYRAGLDLCRIQGDKTREAVALGNLGAAVLESGGRPAEALALVDQALALVREHDLVGEARILSLKMRTLTDTRDLAAARVCGSEALRISEQLGLARFRIIARYDLARLAHAQGHLDEADGHIRSALDELESLRRPLRSADLRASYVASVRSLYDLQVQVLMARHAAQPAGGHDAAAFQAAERGRARSLLDLLAESRANVREGVDADVLAREQSLRERLSAAGVRALRARGEGPEAQQAAARELESLTADLEGVEAQIRARSPRYAALTQPRPATVAEVQASLDEDTSLLAYSLGDEGSHAWLIGGRSIDSIGLAARPAIAAAARRALRSMESEARSGPAIAELSRLVLAPLADRLKTRRLVIVADGALQYVPFAALPHPQHGRALVEDHEVVGLPSASTLVLLRRDRAPRTPTTKTVAVLADPVFDAADERVDAGVKAKAAPAGPLTRAAEPFGLDGAIPRLPFTRREARAILSEVPATSSLAALDFEASRATATDPALADYRIVHFATHGFLNAARPELSGLLLSLVDRQGQPQPGFLTAADTFNLKLAADLVVLSGCRTALGKEIRGEGIVGLARGFMYAGADRVMASLWKVDDAATAALMARFYRAMLGPQGLTPPAALRAAQLEMRRQARYRHPYYWAGFHILGEWR